MPEPVVEVRRTVNGAAQSVGESTREATDAKGTWVETLDAGGNVVSRALKTPSAAYLAARSTGSWGD